MPALSIDSDAPTVALNPGTNTCSLPGNGCAVKPDGGFVA
jgi:hypothetical protein